MSVCRERAAPPHSSAKLHFFEISHTACLPQTEFHLEIFLKIVQPGPEPVSGETLVLAHVKNHIQSFCTIKTQICAN